MKPLLVLPVIALVVIASGCTFPGAGVASSGRGVVIESFEPDFSQIDSTESVQLMLKVKNMGTVDGIIQNVELSGMDWQQVSETCNSIKNSKMLPAVPDKGITGDVKTCYWVMKPKSSEVPAGLSVPFRPTARVTYGYSTSTVKSITIGTSQELRSMQDRGESPPADTITSTSGPIGIDIITKGPVRIYDNGATFPIEISITNSGGGIVCTGSCAADGWNKLHLKLEPASGITLSDCQAESDITLWRGRDNTIGCKASFSDSGSLNGRAQKLIKATATYGYITESTTSVLVTGNSGGSSSYVPLAP